MPGARRLGGLVSLALALDLALTVHAQSWPCPDLTGVWLCPLSRYNTTVAWDGEYLQATPSGETPWFAANGTREGRAHINMVFYSRTGQTAVALGGHVSADCAQIDWSNSVQWIRPNADVDVVHVVAMTHLDVGFTNTSRNVCDLYFDDHFPKAIATAAALRAANSSAFFSYTEFPWLISEYLDGLAGCAHRNRTPAEVALMAEAIRAGYVKWHALPLNSFNELADAALIRHGLTLRSSLNAQFGTDNGATTGKQTDVPGMSRGMVPLLAEAGVRAVHIGYNGACILPDIPSIFVWRDEATSTELIVYAEDNYGIGLTVPAARAALAFMYTSDNGEPPSPSDVEGFFETNLRVKYPNARFLDSSLDNFTLVVDQYRSVLPLVTSEIGDSWTYGAPADPYKLAAFGAARRAEAVALSEGWVAESDPRLAAFRRRLMKGPPEHNWGLSISAYLPALRSQEGNWSNAEFHQVKGRADYVRLELEWAEQRQYNYPSWQWEPPLLAPADGWDQFEALLAQVMQPLLPTGPPLARDGSPTALPDGRVYRAARAGVSQQCGRFNITVSADDGAIVHLSSQAAVYANDSHPLAQFRYQTFDMNDLNIFNEQYNPYCGPPCGDFSKEGCDAAGPVSGTWPLRVVGAWAGTRAHDTIGAAGCTLLVELAPAQNLTADYGAPASVYLNYTLPADDLQLEVTLTWLNKTSTRLPEAMWLSFNPVVTHSSAWRLSVLGSDIDPVDVVVNGTRHLHAAWGGAHHPQVSVVPMDTPLVSATDIHHLLRYEGWTRATPQNGMHFNVFNNLWGTAFPQWYGDNGLARFTVTFAESA